MQRKVLYHSLSHNNDLMFNKDSRDNTSETNYLLRDLLKRKNYLFSASEDHKVNQIDWIIFSEIISTYQGIKGKARKLKRKFLKLPTRDLFQESKNHDNLILLLMEPESVIPENFFLKFHKNFKYIFTWNDELIDNKKYFKIPAVPQPHDYPDIPTINFKDKKLLINISSNKFSKHKDELYSERLRTIRYFENSQPNEFDLYGQNWNTRIKGKFFYKIKYFKSYKGIVKNKWEVIPKYKFGIAYENIKNCSGYITEKIFDIMRCKSIPIYWGAKNIDQYINNDLFIDRRNFSTNSELEKYLISMNESEYNKRLNAINNYLKSDGFSFFKNDNFCKILLSPIIRND